MNPLTSEWVAKAEGDFKTAQREFAVQDEPNYDAVCFHSQQCVEKYLKARLTEGGIAFPKTHDLTVLLGLLLPVEASWVDLRPALEALTSQAVEARYPGTSADRQDAEEAVESAGRVRVTVRRVLGLT